MPEGHTGSYSAPRYRIHPLTKGHRRDDFRCGNEALDRFLQTQARSWMDRGLAQTYVLVSDHDPTVVLGYYSVSMTKIDASDLPEDLGRTFPRSAEIGAVLLGKLAIAQSHQSQGLGRDLLFDALDRSMAAAKDIGAFAMVVDAIDEAAARFYVRHQVERFPDMPLRLFKPFTVHAAHVAAANQR
jgi:GNAT superfamily N-acetyltransferase